MKKLIFVECFKIKEKSKYFVEMKKKLKRKKVKSKKEEEKRIEKNLGKKTGGTMG